MRSHVPDHTVAFDPAVYGDLQTELTGISRHLSSTDGSSAQGWNAKVVPLVDHHLGASARRALEALAAASAAVLLLACLNAAVLVLVHAMTRRTDLAVSRALGASAVRAALPQIAEGALLAAVGGMLGAVLAAGGVRVAVALGADHIPALRDAAVDVSALGFALCVTLAAALLVALTPGPRLAPRDRTGPEGRKPRRRRPRPPWPPPHTAARDVGGSAFRRAARGLRPAGPEPGPAPPRRAGLRPRGCPQLHGRRRR